MRVCANFMFCQDPLQRKLLIQMLDWELFEQGGRERSVDYSGITTSYPGTAFI